MAYRGRCVWLAGLVLAAVLMWLAFRGGSFLVVDTPQKADAIVVLAGETNVRPARALELLRQGYAARILLDVPANTKIYEFTQLELAQDYIRDLGRNLPQSSAITICPIEGLSTRDESKDVGRCLSQGHVRSVLIVTSDFHTRRALSIFRRELPQYQFSTAAARDEAQFGANWWRHRQWAKTYFEEWLRLVWWKVVDHWR
jgi:uncharacterized SAM-binding protein YcdF (DUF218 family)